MKAGDKYSINNDCNNYPELKKHIDKHGYIKIVKIPDPHRVYVNVSNRGELLCLDQKSLKPLTPVEVARWRMKNENNTK